MNKQQVAERLSDECGFSKAQGARVLDAILESITECLRNRDEISFPSFGRFLTAEQKARESVNPRDRSQTIHIDAKTVPKFRAATALKRAVADIPPSAPRPPERTTPATDGTDGAQLPEASSRAPAEWKPLARRS